MPELKFMALQYTYLQGLRNLFQDNDLRAQGYPLLPVAVVASGLYML